MFPDFMHFAVAPRRLAVGKLVLAPLIVGYKLGIVAGTTLRTRVDLDMLNLADKQYFRWQESR